MNEIKMADPRSPDRLSGWRLLRRVATLLNRNRPRIADAMGMGLAVGAWIVGFLLRFEFRVPEPYWPMLETSLPAIVAIKLVVFRAFGLRNVAWRHFGFDDLVSMAAAHGVASVIGAFTIRLWLGPAFPRSIFVVDLLVCLLGELTLRGAIRMVVETSRRHPAAQGVRTLIYGAGRAGTALLGEIRAHPKLGYCVVGFLDDHPEKQRMRVHGIEVLGGGDQLADIARRRRIKQVLIALPRNSGSRLTRILEDCHTAQIAVKRVPAFDERMSEPTLETRPLVDQIREVRLEDLLGRAQVELNAASVGARISGKVVLVTGAGGSIGSELCRQIARHAPRAVVGFDHGETALYQIEQELRETCPDLRFIPEVGTIQDRERLAALFAEHRPEAVYHAAAYKHVPMMEAHLFEAVANNVFGTRNLVEAAVRAGASDFVLISSDKAVRPTNVMGATKRIAELVALATADQPHPPLFSNGTAHGAANGSGTRRPATKIVAVRFGNVLGSNGSVIPRFRHQIAQGGPITVTHPDMRRFFMTIPEAAQLVLEAGAMGSGAQIFVLDMGEPVRIVDLARKLILLSGLRPEIDIRIEITGTRPGEKLYEELSAYEEDTAPTPHSQIRVFTGPPPERQRLDRLLAALANAQRNRDAASALLTLKELVPDYNPSQQVLHDALRTRAQTVVA